MKSLGVFVAIIAFLCIGASPVLSGRNIGGSIVSRQTNVEMAQNLTNSLSNISQSNNSVIANVATLLLQTTQSVSGFNGSPTQVLQNFTVSLGGMFSSITDAVSSLNPIMTPNVTGFCSTALVNVSIALNTVLTASPNISVTIDAGFAAVAFAVIVLYNIVAIIIGYFVGTASAAIAEAVTALLLVLSTVLLVVLTLLAAAAAVIPIKVGVVWVTVVRAIYNVAVVVFGVVSTIAGVVTSAVGTSNSSVGSANFAAGLGPIAETLSAANNTLYEVIPTLDITLGISIADILGGDNGVVGGYLIGF